MYVRCSSVSNFQIKSLQTLLLSTTFCLTFKKKTQRIHLFFQKRQKHFPYPHLPLSLFQPQLLLNIISSFIYFLHACNYYLFAFFKYFRSNTPDIDRQIHRYSHLNLTCTEVPPECKCFDKLYAFTYIAVMHQF